ncbi:MAG: PD-(D/E)XK nuclease family protein [Flavobacteriales bacterium]|nr:PD-(D/E)XK nuclease family protein [Flavobacteriales bacterium]
MHSFLESLASTVLAIDSCPENHLIVLPTKRAGNFFLKILSDKINTPTWLPEIYTLNEWASHISGLQNAEILSSSFILYDSYKEVLGNEAQGLSEFLSWSNTLLSDFNDISAYQINPASLFKELVNYTEIDKFSFLNSPLTEKQESYRRFWQKLPLIYRHFISRLVKHGIGTSGMVMSMAAENCEEYFSLNKNKIFTVAGFNALTNSEKMLLRKMKATGRGNVFFDADNKLLSSDKNSGIFIKKNLKEGLGVVLKSNEDRNQKKLKVQIVKANHKLDQANAVAALIGKIDVEELENTGLVLADESMLVPIIERLPASVKSVNVTMGLNIGQSTFAVWINFWLDLITPFSTNPASGKVKTTKILEFWNLPFSSIINISPINLGENRYLYLKDFQELQSIPSFSSNGKDRLDLIGIIKSGLDWTKRKIEPLNKSLPAVQMAKLGIDKLKEAITHLETFRETDQLNLVALKQIFSQILNSTTLSLIGEPLHGLQIMGVLETRALGFKNLIMCSVDEGNLPKKSTIDSFIPFEIRMFHKLPGRREKEAVYAYQFYRLLNYANNCSTIYNSDTGALGGGGISRYLLQLEQDLDDTSQLSKVEVQTTRIPYTAQPLKVIKDKSVVSLILESIKKRGLSASSINRYYESSHEWFYTHILKLREPETDEINHATFGIIVHETIEKLFEPYQKEIISVDHLKWIKSRVQIELHQSFERNVGKRDVSSGVDRLQFETGFRMIQAYLKREKLEVENGTEIHYLGSEKRTEKKLVIQTSFGPIDLILKGFIDRIERRNGVLHLIDFKTGKVEDRDLNLAIAGDFEKNKYALTKKLKAKGKALQLLLYDWLMRNHFPDEPIKSQIISLHAPSKRNLVLKTSEHELTLEYFEQFLRATVEEMLNPEIALEASEKFDFAAF